METFYKKKHLKGVQKTPKNLGDFWSKIKGLKKLAKIDDFLHIKLVLLSFVQCFIDLSLTQDSGLEYTKLYLIFYDPTFTNQFSNQFIRLNSPHNEH